MKRRLPMLLVAILLVASLGHTSPDKDWAFNGTAIEACSCPMFCQCYFNPGPHAHHEQGGKQFCEFNMAYKINQGHYGDVKLDGAKFWISGDLGANFADGETDWAVVTFDKAMTPAQREGLGAMLPHIFPVKWKSFRTAEGSIDKWEASKDSAHATLDGGKTAEVKLKRATTGNTAQPIVMQNLKYWGTPRNDGFVMMPNEYHFYKGQPTSFEHRNRNGFMITIDMNSKDVAKPKKGM